MITSYVFSNVGGREINEDSAVACETLDHKLYSVCDGLGGHDKGEVASALVTEVLASRYAEVTPDNAEDFLGDSLMIAQNMLISEQIAQKATDDMKTTATAVLIHDRKVYRAYCGDSRIYVFHKNKVKEHTKDHSVPQMLVMAREIKEKDIRNHPDRNRLLKVMGTDWDGDAKYTVEPVLDVKNCQAIMMCTDGFWELIEEKQMCKLLKKSKTVQEWVEEMAKIVHKNGEGKNMDNNTCIGVWLEE